MRKRYVIIEAWVPDEWSGEGSPEQPIELPPPEIGGGPILPPRPSLPPGWERPGLPPDWQRPEFPGWPERPGHRPPGWRPGRPWYPDQGLPPEVGGGPIIPGRPTLPPGWERPEFPGWPERPGNRPPGWRPSFPWYPDQGLPPEVGGGPVIPPRPGIPPDFQRPEVPEGRFTVWPVVEAEDIGGHPELPDMNLAGQWIRIAVGKQSPYWAWVSYEHGPTPENYEPKPPSRGAPGQWVTVLWYDQMTWAWVPSIDLNPDRPPERPTPSPRPPGEGPEVDPTRR